MKYKKFAKIFGFLFSVGLAVLAYFSLIVGIVLAFDGNDWFVVMIYVFAGLAVANIVGLFFVKKKPIVAFVINAFSSVVVLLTTIYLVSVGLISESPQILILYIGVLLLGVLTSVLAFISKKQIVQSVE